MSGTDAVTAQKWLLVFDNAEGDSQLQQYWPGVGNGTIIITTRHPHTFFDMAGSALHIEPFSEEEGADCLLSLTRAKGYSFRDKRAALRLSRWLGGLPLGISQMAAFTRTRGLDIKKCEELYGGQKRRMHKDAKSARYSEYKQDLTTVWVMQFEALNEMPDAKTLLGVLTFLSPDSIPEVLFDLPEEVDDSEIPPNLLFCKDYLRYAFPSPLCT